MYRAIGLIKRKGGLSHRRFRDYYETHHRPLGEKAMNGFGLSYERYYLYSMSDGTECTGKVQSDSARARIFAENDLNFPDPTACLHFEAQDSFSKLQPIPPGDTIFRTVALARHRADMTHEQCRACYEK